MKHVSLETAKRLKEAGWEQETDGLFWVDHSEPFTTSDRGDIFGFKSDHDKGLPLLVFAAPSTDDLLEALPARVHVEIFRRPAGNLKGHVYGDGWYVRAHGRMFEADSISDCLASLWLSLREKKLV